MFRLFFSYIKIVSFCFFSEELKQKKTAQEPPRAALKTVKF